jgi:hypothetical protein
MPRVPANLRTRIQFVCLLIQQQDSDILQVEVVARDDQDLLQHFIEIKRGQYRLAGIVKNGYFLHVAAGFYSALLRVAEVSKVTIELKGR